jgi:hypothetical protein
LNGDRVAHHLTISVAALVSRGVFLLIEKDLTETTTTTPTTTTPTTTPYDEKRTIKRKQH